MNKSFSNLVESLSNQFSADEARDLARLFSSSCQADSITYEELDLDAEVKDDIILLAYEERVLLPMKSRRGSAWEDRILAFTEDERYHLPRVVRFLIEDARKSSQWNIDLAIGKALGEAGENNVNNMVDYLNRVKKLSSKYEVEVGVMQVICNELNLNIDMHDTLDRFVRCGIMSPRTQRSLHTGISIYEMNPCLYWK
ncbi:MAG: hypothetical protein HQ553_13130 [Chloroflexi bacterium]|nr:hypothetical protein [Chloroflexota bacterium]